MRLPRRHALDSKQLKQALMRAALETLTQDPYVNVLPQSKTGSSTFATSSQYPGDGGADQGLASIDLITIRTSQTQWLAFTRDKTDTFWKGLEKTLETVFVATVDNIWDPKHANVHRFAVDDVIARLDKIYRATKNAGKIVKPGVPILISLYDMEEKDPPPPLHLIGAGIGIKYPPIARVPLKRFMSLVAKKRKAKRLTLSQARKQLALSYDVPISAVTITIDRSARQTETASSAIEQPAKTLSRAQAMALIRRNQREAEKASKFLEKELADKMVDRPKKKRASKIDVYRGKQDNTLRLIVRTGHGVPDHLNANEWELLPHGTRPLVKGIGGDIRARGFGLYKVYSQ
jgi:hypothetical protein